MMDIYTCANNHLSYFQCIKTKVANSEAIVEYCPREDKIWLIFHLENSPMSKFLSENIPRFATHRKVILITKGTKFEMFTPDSFAMRPHSEQDVLQLMESVNNINGIVEGIVYCWSLDAECTSQKDILQPYFYLAKSLPKLKSASPLRMCALISGVAPLEDSDLTQFHSSSICGFIKALRNENSELLCKYVDVGSQSGENDMFQVLSELWNPAKETQVAYKGSIRHTAKFNAHKSQCAPLELPTGGGDRFKLILPQTNSISDLKFGTLDHLVLKPSEIEIQVKASALNFRDVLSVLKPSDYFKDRNSVGVDVAGVVTRVGSKASKLSVGDRVYGGNLDGMALPSHAKLHEDCVNMIPENWTFCEAATLPVVAATSIFCLIEDAKVTSSDTVLIHTASGGVGLCAIQICQSIGATIIATAGSKRKQNYLRGLGISYVFNSRNTEYAEQILEATNGYGVDVVLNSLTSDGFKEATLSVCAEGARFVEMSKLSIWTLDDVRRLRPDVKYSVFDLTLVGQTEIGRSFKVLEDIAKRGVITPLPYVRFDAVNIREAMRYMQKAKHIGKVVCAMPEFRQSDGRITACTPMFHENASYLITGGLGGVGFEVCKWMVRMGAKQVILAGRSPPSPEIDKAILLLNSEHSANVKAVYLDVSSFHQCKYLIQNKMPEMGYPTLRGIMHAAGTLQDGLIEKQNWQTFSSTFATKIDGTINLHELTKGNSFLEHFVMFSSVASIFGSPGQSNHAAGNNFEDVFAHYRRSIGLPATTVNWGQWGEVGVAKDVTAPGIKPFSVSQGIKGLEYALKSQRTQTGVINIDSLAVLSNLCPHIASYVDERLWRQMSSTSAKTKTQNSEDFWLEYDAANGDNEKLNALKLSLRCILRNILKLDEADKIDDYADFQEMGVDSLMLVEIKNCLQTVFGERVVVSSSVLRECTTLASLSTELLILIERPHDVDGDDVPTMQQVNDLIKEDSILPATIIAKATQRVTPVTEVSCVLLTGSTGNLGPYILKELSQRKQITQIFCLVRSGKNLTGEQRILNILSEKNLMDSVDMKKIRCIDGNVAFNQLGMEAGVWKDLSDKVDAIFHCAALVQHMDHYKKYSSDKDMRAVNIGGTKHVLEFACAGTKLKRVYCASSIAAVATVDEDGNVSENWPQPNDYDGVTTFAYPITKFVGDVLMKQAVMERGIPGKVFRFPGIVGNSVTGGFDIKRNHVMLRYLFILKHGMIPSNPFPISVIPVDIGAWASVSIFLNPDAPDDVYNVCREPPAADQEFTNVAKRLGYNVDIVEFSEFSEKIRQSATDDSPYAVFKEFYKSDEDLMALYSSTPVLRQWFLEGSSNEEFMVGKKIANYLPEFFQGKCSAMEHIYRDLMLAKRQGWLDKYTL